METRLLTAITSVLLVCLLSGGCSPTQDFDTHLRSIVKPYSFSILEWEGKTIPHEVNEALFSKHEKINDEVRLVTEFFSLTEQIKALKSAIERTTSEGQDSPDSLEAELNRLQEQRMALSDTVERIIEGQIRETLTEQGIYHPIDDLVRPKLSFPPVNFKLERPPNLLVVSPRDRIESMREITLKQDISLKQIEDIEASVDELGVSSLVVELGGLGATYPTFVTNEANLRFTLDTATEEWLHQYLAFKPLGFLYLLDITGISRNYEIATMNETLASMVSKEIGSILREKYYAQNEDGDTANQTVDSAFDFNREMRNIRRAVDQYLARGEIEQAEAFMEQKRQYLADNGYYIRKLNQAYFAFHGTYADRPTSISPIGLELKQLRSQSASLKEFLNTVAAMKSRHDLIMTLD